MAIEFDTLLQHCVGTLVNPPPDTNILGGMWVFAKKRNGYNHVIHHKACWVVFGNHQIEGIDFNDTYASVGKIDSLRILIALAVSKKMLIRQFDVETVFLNGDMKDLVYCRQVTGFDDKTNAHRVWFLNKSLYGTRQSARRWKRHFSKTASVFGFRPTVSDKAVYFVKDKCGIVIIHLHVYDSLVFCDNKQFLEDFKVFIHSVYKSKWTNNPTLYLGIKLKIKAEHAQITISRPQYIESILNRFSMKNCKASKSPLPAKISLIPGTKEEIKAAQRLPFQQLVGCLEWLGHTTCPDICYTISQVSRVNAPWTLAHWTSAKHILRYLQGSSSTGLT